MLLRSIVSMLALVLAGCAIPMNQPPPPLPRMPFPEAEYQALPKVGTAVVKGQAFLKTRGGDVKVAAGNEVLLNPVTSYSLEWYEKSYLPNRRLEDPDPRLSQFTSKQTADGSGRFTFKNVPAGEYFVTTIIRWEAPTGYQGALQLQGGAVTKRVKISDGEEIEVVITR